jgi:hypothetical protein
MGACISTTKKAGMKDAGSTGPKRSDTGGENVKHASQAEI